MNWFLRVLVGATASGLAGGFGFAVILIVVNSLWEGGAAANLYVWYLSALAGFMYGSVLGALIGGTAGLCAPGTYALAFRVAGDPVTHTVQFRITK